MIGEFCVVRTDRAGVHMGTVKAINGRAVLLEVARRLWSWGGAFSLHEVAVNGASEDSRISEPVARVLLLDAIEVIATTQEAQRNLCRTRNNPSSAPARR